MRLVTAILLFGITLPIALYWFSVGRAPALSAAEARDLLDSKQAALVVIEPGSASDRYIDSATRWPVQSILQARTPDDLPPDLRGRRLLLICPGGVHSAQAALHLQGVGIDAWRIRGGSQGWISAPAGSSADTSAVPAFRASPLYEQLAIIATFFGVKLIYSVLSAMIVLKLRHRAEPDLAALRNAMLLFFVGEACCFINVMAFRDDSPVLEHFHSVGMVVSLAFAAYALLEAIDRRLIHYSDRAPCTFGPLCRGCIKHSAVPCGLRRLFLLFVPATALIAIIPLFSSLRDLTYNTRVIHAMHTYKHPIVHQVYELRILPLMALVLLVFCLGTLLVERYPVSRAKVFFTAAIGAVGFSFFRLVLVASFIDNQVWFAAWEETTELIYVATAGGLLLIFARGLFAPEPASAAAGAST